VGRRRRMETTLLKKNSMLDSVGNEENAYPVPDSKKSKINATREPAMATKNTLKEEILYESTEKFMEKILHMVNQNVQTALKKFQDTKNKEHEKTLKKKMNSEMT
jgi:hypothetical protein